MSTIFKEFTRNAVIARRCVFPYGGDDTMALASAEHYELGLAAGGLLDDRHSFADRKHALTLEALRREVGLL